MTPSLTYIMSEASDIQEDSVGMSSDSVSMLNPYLSLDVEEY